MDARVRELPLRDFSRYIDARPQDGVLRIHLDLFRDPELFELEMRYIYERSWVFVGHAAQIPQPNDFITGVVGRTPIILQRGGDGQVRAFINHCSHRGATVATTQAGNARRHKCPYHGWMFDSTGKCLQVTDEALGGYTDAFRRLSHDLPQVARLEEYRGFFFASLNPDVMPLREYLGDAAVFMDSWIDQSPDGLEVVRGDANFTYGGNWKMVFENCLDIYHAKTLHASFGTMVMNRVKRQGADENRSVDLNNFISAEAEVSYYIFPKGHGGMWLRGAGKREDRPSYAMWQEMAARVGEDKADMMVSGRVVAIFPNILLVESATFQMRLIRPVAVDKTEVYAFCLAPKGEPAAARALRIRQYEDFFSATGVATPDDTTVYERVQQGDQARSIEWNQGYHRGLALLRDGPDEAARRIGIEPLHSISGNIGIQGEAVYLGVYQGWLEQMQRGQAQLAGVQA
ncbi:MAG: Rieske 2Fe-2S domain-containing protein [Immundisolibacter sp.]|uniref:aromatic ring-hydroxylating oxygenase subunit alpha n=1 Tax=Immundisolibacter sp. TaxID=1934948 RepID=UPI0019C4112A|nr:Rieske 2Fe-2S domain-containing protein [Immundisolibacter sp.]MBC7162115.1 Rieske 2Fe-2S domain-containing protein [Immundisolibacter sp.]